MVASSWYISSFSYMMHGHTNIKQKFSQDLGGVGLDLGTDTGENI
jgi:hypothetical protein